MTRVPKVAVFFGTRPEAIKLAPVITAISADRRLELLSVSTGQHREMLQQVVDIFELPVHEDLALMTPGQTLAGLSSRLIAAVDDVIERHRPDFAIVQGDTTTVLMASIACFYRRVPIGHVEAGLRTGDLTRPFPEEANRVMVSPITTLHFPPTTVSRDNLLREGVEPSRVLVTGNTVIDALHAEVARQDRPEIAAAIDEDLNAHLPAGWRDRPMVLITGHRRENFGDGFDQICGAIGELADRFGDVQFVYPVHLNPNVQGPVQATLGRRANVHLIPPRAYRPFVALMRAATLVLTDSGGVQEEAPGLGKPVLVMRETTERPEGVTAGTVRLVGADRSRIVSAVSELLTDRAAYDAMARANNPYGDGRAAARIVDAVARWL